MHFQIIAELRASVPRPPKSSRRWAGATPSANGSSAISADSARPTWRPTAPLQAIRLSEEQYHWLLGKHPVIQERVNKMRSLLPRLQLAQERARLKAALEPGARSVIEHMKLESLSGFAIFSVIKEFKQGHHVLVEGDEVDGFYILLSGHLAVGTEGRSISELSEGDVFGEVSLLEGATREATVTVVSPHAENLFMSTRSFQHLLHRCPPSPEGSGTRPPAVRELIRRP